MSYENLLFEFMNRVKNLEDKVNNLEIELEELKNERELSEVDEFGSDINENEEMEVEELVNETRSRISRSFVREHVMKKLREENPGFEVKKANKAQGSGIVLLKDQLVKSKIKLLASRNYIDGNSIERNGERLAHSWHTLPKSDIENGKFDAYIFVYFYEQEYHSFVFSKREIEEFVREKTSDGAGNFYFYFVIYENERLETRDEILDVSEYYEKFKIEVR
jgi:hypothetical protein